ncbi:hypothetical protein [Microcoleus sp. CZ3-B4]|uniref:hypothetical protein n=1 Tax=Microcoleus sp. CZ3-B4 TaxID=2818733 RepID=UPI002FCF25EC
MRYADVEVRRDDRDAPNVQLHGTAAARASATTETTAPQGAIALCTPPENNPLP